MAAALCEAMVRLNARLAAWPLGTMRPSANNVRMARCMADWCARCMARCRLAMAASRMAWQRGWRLAGWHALQRAHQSGCIAWRVV
jgi:hypothetical protein